MPEFLYGRNAARECLRARRRHVHELLLTDNVRTSAVIEEITTLAGELGIRITRVSRKALDKFGHGHQGVALKTGRYPTVELEDILFQAKKLKERAFIVILDHLEDPNNLGAILRTAEVAGVHGVILPKQRAAGITPAVVNVSAGAVEHMLIAEVPNLTRTIKDLKQNDVWVAGVEYEETATPYYKANLVGAIALVIGSEGKGLSRLVRDTCDFLVKLPMRGRIESLNASVACGLIMYEVWRARGFK